jgi:flagellin
MQQLAVVGANGSLSNTQRGAVVTELQNLNSQINSFSTGTTYNNIVLLGTTGSIDLATSTLANGAAAGTFGSVSNLNVSQSTSALITYTASGNNLQAYNGTITQSVTLVGGTIGQSQAVNFNQIGVSFTLTSAGTGTAAQLATGLTTLKSVVTLAGIGSLNFQVGASTNSGDQIQVAGYNISTTSAGTSTAMQTVGTLITGSGTNLTGLQGAGSPTDSQWTSAFQSLQTNSSTALSDLSTQRAVMGAKMNQLGYITTNLEAQAANERAARSTIVDTNYSMETAALTKGQILQQAATAMLAQANQMPNVILSLLK